MFESIQITEECINTVLSVGGELVKIGRNPSAQPNQSTSAQDHHARPQGHRQQPH